MARRSFILISLWILATAAFRNPRTYGDGLEYQLMAESLARHLSPELRAADVASLAKRCERFHVPGNFAAALGAYYPAECGRRYCYHFWGYSLATVPAKLLLRLLGRNDLKAGQLTNALLFVFALHRVLFRSTLSGRVPLALLVLFSPALWFILWCHPEVFSFCLVLLALVESHEGRGVSAVLCASLAALQNPPILWLVLWLALKAAFAAGAGGRARTLVLAGLASLPLALPAAFFYWHFGTASVIARESTSLANLSLRRALELFLDLNIGMLPYAPLALLLFAGGLVLALAGQDRAPIGSAVVLLLMALSCTVTGNWNHGTSGPSRYVVWMLPLVFLEVARLAPRWGGALVAAVVLQATLVFTRGGMVQPPDYLAHSYAARFVLRVAPRLYNPSFEIFVARTTADARPAPGPVAYRDGAGCRKALAARSDAEDLEALCGPIPAAQRGFFEAKGPENERTYVDY